MVAVLAAAPIAIEVAAIQQTNVGCVAAEGDLDDLARELTGRVDGAVDARVVEDTVHLSVRGGRRLLPQVLAAADDAGFQVSDISVNEPTLETVFISLTGKDLRE